MLICIFCDNELSGDTKPEHILSSALGGRKTTKRVVCSNCNQTFGGGIDAAMASQVAVLRNQLQLESGTGKPPPGLGRRQAGNETIKIASDGTPELVGKPFVVTPLGDGRYNLLITARSPDELASVIPHIAAQMKTTEDIVRKQIMAADAAVISRRPGPIHFHTPFGGDDECKSLLKSCLVLWATRVGNDELKSAPYDVARKHVSQISDHGTRRDLSAAKIVHLDSRPLPHLDILKTRYGEFFNLIYVRSDAAGRVVGHFTLYNIISWQFALAESGGTPNLKTALVSNPLDPSSWSDTIADDIDIDMAWLNSPDFDVSRARDRLTAAIVRSQSNDMEREIGRIAATVFQKHGLAENDAITDPATFRLVMAEINRRIAHHVMNIPFEEVVSGKELLASVKPS